MGVCASMRTHMRAHARAHTQTRTPPAVRQTCTTRSKAQFVSLLNTRAQTNKQTLAGRHARMHSRTRIHTHAYMRARSLAPRDTLARAVQPDLYRLCTPARASTHAHKRTHTRRHAPECTTARSHLREPTARAAVRGRARFRRRATPLHEAAHNGHMAAAAALLAHGADVNAKDNDGCGGRLIFAATSACVGERFPPQVDAAPLCRAVRQVRRGAAARCQRRGRHREEYRRVRRVLTPPV
jgi:hypothetical protein